MNYALAMPGAARASVSPADRRVAGWLLVMAALVFAIVLVGGATRLTESGLSIVVWEPVAGVVPPLSADAWQAEFERYRTSPQYLEINRGMSLAEFKTIFWWEYGHRALGRLIGVAFLVPLIFFWARGMIRPDLKPKLVALFVLGGLQGLLGWLMVASGLVDRPSVSHYRLAAHFSLAVIIYVYMLWLVLDLLRPAPARPFALWRPDRRTAALFLAVAVLTAMQLVWGAFVAGLRAGYAFNTWPLMDGSFLPAGFAALSPFLANLVENPGTVQFLHRMLAYALFAGSALLWWRLRRAEAPGLGAAAHFLLAAMVLQVGLGILTVVKAVPIWLGVAHQGGALVVVTALVVMAHRMARSHGVPQ